MEFVVRIRMGSERLLNPLQGRQELRKILARLREQLDNGRDSGALDDTAGNAVGVFGFTQESTK